MKHEEYKNLAAGYALDVLDEAERLIFERHLASGCASCQAELEEMRATGMALAMSTEPVAPPPALKSRVMAGIQPEKQRSAPLPTAKPAQSWWNWGWGLSFALAAGLVFQFVSMQGLQQEVDQLKAELNTNRVQLIDLRNQLRFNERVIKIVQGSDLQIYDLEGQEVSLASSGKVWLNPEEGSALFEGLKLPAPPSDKDYQLWYLRGARAFDAGVFSLDENGVANLIVDNIRDTGSVSAFAVTLEPKGGRPQPSGRMYLVGTQQRG